MTRSIVVTGTDTGIGKTVFAAGLAGALGLPYWKPIQAGLDGETDSALVARLAGCAIRSEVYRLTTPASPHRAAEIDGVAIDIARLAPPEAPHVIEGAGGVMVPLTRDTLQIDLFARWRLPLVIVASTRLGTINHSLLTIEAARTRGIPLIGIAFVGAANEDSERTICDMGKARRLGRLPVLDTLDAGTLHSAFAGNFRIEDFVR
jgi:dethiobiotin synthetase